MNNQQLEEFQKQTMHDMKCDAEGLVAQLSKSGLNDHLVRILIESLSERLSIYQNAIDRKDEQ